MLSGLLIGGLALCHMRESRCVRLSAMWLACIFLYYVVAIRTTSGLWAWYYHIVSVPPAALLFGAGLEQLRKRDLKPWLIASASAFSVLLATVVWRTLSTFVVGRSPQLAYQFLDSGVPLVADLTIAAAAFLLTLSMFEFPDSGSPPAARVPSGAAYASISLGIAVSFVIGMHLLLGDWRRYMNRSDAYTCAVSFSDHIAPRTLIVSSGGICSDVAGHPVASDAPNMFYWLDRKGFSLCEGQQSRELLEEYHSRGASFFVADKVSVEKKTGFCQRSDRQLSNSFRMQHGLAVRSYGPKKVGEHPFPLSLLIDINKKVDIPLQLNRHAKTLSGVSGIGRFGKQRMKQTQIGLAFCMICLVGGSVTAMAQVADPGKVYYQKLESASFDQFTNSPNAAAKLWLETKFFRMGVFTPYFDTRTSWFPNSLFYINLYGVAPTSYVKVSQPQWILKDQSGNLLYIPWGCSGGTCASYAADISNPSFRAWWISQAQADMSKGYLGMWIDDVDMQFNVSDGNGNPAAPMDSSTGLPMTWAAWRNYVATFLEQIRQSFPYAEINHNSVWYAGPAGVRDTDPAIQRQILAASNLNLERGIGSDPGLTGGTGIWSVYALLAYIDRVHALGRNVTLQEYQIDQPTQQYALAGYYLISTGSDRVGDDTSTPTNWWSGWNTYLGAPLGPRTYTNGVFRRSFTGGLVLLGEPGLATQTIALPAAYTTLDGQSVTSVSLAGHQGIVLLGTGSTGTNVNHYISDLTPSYSVNGYGVLQKDVSNQGHALSLNGVKFAKGLGAHAYSENRYALSGACSAFTSKVGIDDEIPPGLGSVIFQVWADGTKLYDSGILQSGSPAGSVSVNIAGTQTLSLIVTNGVPGINCDHGDWANAIITCDK